MSAASSSNDRNLLFGIMAMQMGLIPRDGLLSAMVSWVEDSGRPLARILIDRGLLGPDDVPTVERAVARHLASNGHDDPARWQTAPDLTLDGGGPDLHIPPGKAVVKASRSPTPPPAAEVPEAPDATTAFGEAPPRREPPPGPGPEPEDQDQNPTDSRYTTLRSHAKGGLGEVFVAWDRELGRQVALKEIRSDHADDPGLRSRFLREAEINGNLEHPGIVPIHGMGTHRDGRPYYAMRFVDGETLQEAVDRFHAARLPIGPERTLGLRDLLRRFIDVCEAIAYAHSKGVIHRDLKPSNVMLGPYGETLIIDWGLAKVIGREEPSDPPSGPPATERIAPVLMDSLQLPTTVGETLGSPPYMSPEQAEGRHDELGRPTDIYSLGATLYTVITGKAPLTGRAKDVLARVIRGQIDPPIAVEPRVPPALDAICRKAMRLRPEDRYESARDLARDLERWMADEEVSVHRDSPATRLVRWGRRHKSLVAGSLALTLATVSSLSVGLVLVERQRQQADEARLAAELARHHAREHLKVGLDLVDQLVTFGDRQLIAQQAPRDRARFLQTAEVFLRSFREREPDDPEVQRDSGMIARRLANLYRLTGAFDQAGPLYGESVAILSALVERLGDAPEDRDLLAEAIADQAEALLLFGRPREAEAMLDVALGLARGNAPERDPPPEFQRTLARVLSLRGAVDLALGRSEEARIACEEAIRRILPQADAALPALRDQIADGRYLPLIDQLFLVAARHDLAWALDRLGDREAADGQRLLAFNWMVEVAGALDGLGIPDVDHYLGWVAADLARSLVEFGEPEGDRLARARAILDEAIPRLEALIARNDDFWQFQTCLADALAVRSLLFERTGDTEAARQDAGAARALVEPLAPAIGGVPEAWSPLADALEALARLGPDRSPPDPDAARALLRLALDARRRVVDGRPGDPVARDLLAAVADRLAALDADRGTN